MSRPTRSRCQTYQTSSYGCINIVVATTNLSVVLSLSPSLALCLSLDLQTMHAAHPIIPLRRADLYEHMAEGTHRRYASLAQAGAEAALQPEAWC